MNIFKYYATDKSGNKYRGSIEAETARQARHLLRKQGMLLLSIKKNNSRFLYSTLFIRQINYTDLAFITRQLAVLITASIPIEEALRTISKQSEKKTLIVLLDKIRNKIIAGYSFSHAIASYPQTFNPTYQAMVLAGEKSGHLGSVLNRLSDHIEQSQKIKNKITHALIYPCLLITVSIAIIAILLTFVMPQVIEQFVYMKKTLPLATRVLMAINNKIHDYGFIFILIVISNILLLQKLLQRPSWKIQWHRYYLRLPLLGKLSIKLNTARYTRTLSILNSNGVPLLTAMSISASVSSNIYASRQLSKSTELIREGNSLSAVLKKSQLFSPIVIHMISSGESSGQINNMLERVARLCP